ncbi:MAG: reprolysin-like metallopeptidase [Bacteroidota bacterium]
MNTKHLILIVIVCSLTMTYCTSDNEQGLPDDMMEQTDEPVVSTEQSETTEEGQTTPEDIVEQTVLVVYTPKSREVAESLSVTIQQHTQEFINATNIAYKLSGINVRLAIADVRSIDFNFTEEVITNDPNATSLTAITALVDPNDGIVDEIHIWRDEVNADIAILKNDFCGGAATPCQSDYVSETLGFADIDGAFALVGNESCTQNPFTFAHEIGHIQGCNHQPGSGATNPNAPYANGYVSAMGRFRTIMATASADRVGIFSGPDVIWEGFITGTPELNDSARGINESAEKIASLR